MQKKRGFTLIELLVVIAIIGILCAVVISAFQGHRSSNGGVSFAPQKAEACGWFSSCDSASNLKAAEQESVSQTFSRLVNAVPAPKLNNSLERQNISNRLTLFSDPNKISYIYLTSYGKVMAFYAVKGKITSGSKRLTAEQQFVNPDEDYNGNAFAVEAPELDGTYGHSADYIYFWTTEGAYVQWNGEYMLSDQPLKLTTTPELIRDIK